MGAIIVLGGHRTGTSVTARIIHELGFPAAPALERLLWPRPGHERDNPDGYWEDVAFVRLHRRMLGEQILALGGWRNPRRDDAVIAALKPRYRRLVEERATHSLHWCLKDPRLCLLADVLFEVLNELQIPFQVITCLRPAAVVVRSLMRRGLNERDACFLASRFESGRQAMCELACAQCGVCRELPMGEHRPAFEIRNEIERLLATSEEMPHVSASGQQG